MLLFIDTTDNESVELALVTGGKILNHIFKVNYNLSEVLIPEIKKFLKKIKIKFTDLKKIAVVIGPGHFSKIRTAVAVANALAYSLDIRVVGIKTGQKIDLLQLSAQKGKSMAGPFYGRGPNITMPKKTTR